MTAMTTSIRAPLPAPAFRLPALPAARPPGAPPPRRPPAPPARAPRQPAYANVFAGLRGVFGVV